MTNLPTTQGNQLPADPAQMQDYFAQYAQAYAETERRPGSSISIRNGVMMVGDQTIPGNQFAGIVMDAVRLNAFYGTAYNPQVTTPPTCYAIGRTEMDMAPHPDMQKDLSWFQPQAERCVGCPHNEFGTARQGAGKACSNRRRMLILLAGVYQNGQLQPYTDIDHYNTSDFLTLSIAPTSTPGWGKFVKDMADQYRRPPFGMIARIYIYPHPKHGKEAVGFDPIAPVPDEWVPTIVRRQQQAATEVFEGYEPPQRQAAQQAAPGGGFRGVQQGAWGQR